MAARYFAEKGKKVTIWERRNHIGGNMYDYIDEHGVLVHKYGPHVFHTNSVEAFTYVCRFSRWKNYLLTCGAIIDGKCTPTPFNFQTIDDYYTSEDAALLKERILKEFGEQKTVSVTEALSHPDKSIKSFAQFLFEKDYSPYTAKQWGISPSEIDPSVLKRVPLKFSYDEGYFDDTYQILPAVSYSEFFSKLLDHPNINVSLGVDALEHLSIASGGNEVLLNGVKTGIPIVYTGALDELIAHADGVLPYRSLRFEWIYKHIESFQSMPVVAYPQAVEFTRITEYKKLPLQNVRGTTYAVEYPLEYSFGLGHEPYYPVLTDESCALYGLYKKRIEKIKNLYVCGRLGDFRYYNMDQALLRALDLCKSVEFI